MFSLQEHPIDPADLKADRRIPTDGAFVCFEGIVRCDRKNGKDVSALLYIADAPACIEEGQKIMTEVLAQFPVTHAVCVQRTGQVTVGEAGVWIGVWAGH